MLRVGDNRVLVLRNSNLRPVKCIDLILEAAACIHPRDSFKLVILAGESFTPFQGGVRRLGLDNDVVVREQVSNIGDYLQAADLGLFAS